MELLEYLVHSCDVQAQTFRFGEHFSKITIEDIYFMKILSIRGAPISLLGGRRSGEMVKDYIATYCRARTKPTRDGKSSIKNVTHFPLRTILFIISILTGSSTLHVAIISYMKYGGEFLQPTIFNWSEGVLVNMKEQLYKAREGMLKNFGYSYILVSFSLERVPLP